MQAKATPWWRTRDVEVVYFGSGRMDWAMSDFPSDQIGPGTRWLSAMTASNELMIQSQSASEIVSEGSSLMVWLAWPATWVRILCSLNSGITMSWQNRPVLTVSSTFHDALSLSERGAPNSMPII